VGALVQNAFCASVGPVPSLGAALVRQLNADTVFLLEALVDLRLQPTPQLAGLALRLKDAATASQQ
jgi:hypothetical protein